MWLDAVALRMARPTSVDPVKAILATSGCFTSASPVEPSPVTMLTTPGGSPDFRADLGESQRGQRRELSRLEHYRIARGQRRRYFPGQHEQREIPGNDLPDDAARGVSGKFLMQQLRPAGMVIEVADDERNIDIAALANGLAVVHGFEHGEAAGMLLHGSRQSVEMAGSRMRSTEPAILADAALAARTAASISAGEPWATVASFSPVDGSAVSKYSASDRLPPCAANEMSEAATVEIEPGQGLFRVLGCGAVFHRDEFFGDAHMSVRYVRQ